jgi:hypothetical protein
MGNDAWQEKLASVRDPAGIVEVASEFVAGLSPDELASLPDDCRPPARFVDTGDVTECAYALARRNCIAPAGSSELVARLAAFFSGATYRLTRLEEASAPRRSRAGPAEG